MGLLAWDHASVSYVLIENQRGEPAAAFSDYPAATGVADILLFGQHFTALTGKDKSGTVVAPPATLYASWKKANPAEATAYETYARAVLNGARPQPPTMRTKTGIALVLAGEMAANG
jgi:hypothetical protein